MSAGDKALTMPSKAMVLAAGLGTRLRPLTAERPKALVELRGRPLIDGVLDRLAEAGVSEAVVNLHYHGEMLRHHLQNRAAPRLRFSDEAEALLDTGGGIAKALPLLGPAPFFVVASDILWLNGTTNTLKRLAAAWDDARMDALLLMHPTALAIGYNGGGDFLMAADGAVARRPERLVAPFVYASVQIVHPRLFADAPSGAFSMNRLWDRAIDAGRLFGLRHDGVWMLVDTPDGLAAAEAALAEM